MKRAALHNLGCKVNEYETEAMQELLELDGYEIVPFDQIADVYVVNTCSVTNMADRKSRQMLHRGKKLNPNAVIIAAGCYVQTAIDEVKVDPEIDIILGNNKKTELIPKLHKFLEEHKKETEYVDINQEKVTFETLYRTKTGEHTRAFLKVQDGCNQFCTYCIIPYARGRVRSRDIQEVCQEVRGLSEAGFREFVLTGIHLDSYGVGQEYGLIDLVEEVAKIPGVERIRFGSIEPRIITEEFARRLKEIPSFCPHFHLSLQSGCDRTLKRMNRKYTTEEYENGVKLLRDIFEEPAITTDVIVGFPGETEEDFEECRDFLEKIKFYEMHVFKFSRRKGTPADRMEGQLTDAEKTKRSKVLLEMVKQHSEEYRNSKIGKLDQILIEEKIKIDGDEYWTGFTKEYIRMACKSEKDLKNKIVLGTVTKMLTKDVMLLDGTTVLK